MPLSLLGLGSNLGDPAQLLADALLRLRNHADIELLRQSRLYCTQPAGGPAGQAAYLNAAAVVRTSLSPQALLKACQAVENDLGRRREERWGPRSIDIDLLLYDDLVLNEPDLQIPHPRMAWRRFVLEPAAEIAAEMVHPVVDWTVGHLLYHLNSTPWYLAIEEPLGVAKFSVVADVAQRLNARLLTDPFRPPLSQAFSYVNPSGHQGQIDLEFLLRCTRQLDKMDTAWASREQATVSNFWSEIWLERSAAQAKRLLPADQLAEYMAVWKELRWRVVRPRLRAILLEPPEGLPPNACLRHLDEAIVRQFRSGSDQKRLEWSAKDLEKPAIATPGPTLWLNPFDKQTALAELTAAVEAMR